METWKIFNALIILPIKSLLSLGNAGKMAGRAIKSKEIEKTEERQEPPGKLHMNISCSYIAFDISLKVIWK